MKTKRYPRLYRQQKRTRATAIDIIGVPIDLGVRELGLRIGPDGFREAHLLAVARQAGLVVHDVGNIKVEIVPEPQNRGAKNLLTTQSVT